MQYLWKAFIIACAIFYPCQGQTDYSVDVHGESVVVMNADTGVVLYEKNARQLRHPASITKIATALYALKRNRGHLDSEVIAEQGSIGTVKEEEKKRSNYRGPPYRLIVGGTHIMIKAGEILPLRALLYGLMLESANDAANVIAQYTSGKITGFMQELNQYLKGIGCLDTRFMNPSGIHHPEHKTTAYDMALMTREALKERDFCEIVKSTRYIRPKTNKQDEMPMYQHNQLLKRGKYYYEYATGVKTGYYSIAGHNLAASAECQGRALIIVTMGCKNRGEPYQDAILLFNRFFQEQPIIKTLVDKRQTVAVPLQNRSKLQILSQVDRPVQVEYYPSEPLSITAHVDPVLLPLPVRKGERVGEIVFSGKDGTVIKTAPLYASEEVHDSWPRRMSAQYQQALPALRFIMLVSILLICGLAAYRLLRKNRGTKR